MAVAGGGDGGLQSSEPWPDLLARLTCPVCLEVFESPVRVPCGHVCSSQRCAAMRPPVQSTRIT
uniref:Zinc finger RING-type eukaryotic domain-containing protein n=1 Tax=Pavo cristatus TaxID=9049 RepID=A0A8C9FVC7_PAVCR